MPGGSSDTRPGRSGWNDPEVLCEEILAQVHDAVMMTDLAGHITSWNPAASRVYGWSASEVVGRHIGCLCFEEERPRLEEDVLGPLREAGTLDVTLRNRHKSGDEIFVAVRLSLLHDEAGRPVGMIGCSNDVTALWKVADEARRERELATAMFETAQSIVLVLDVEGRILRFNPFMEELTGYRLDEVRGRDWFETFLLEEDRPRVRGIFGQAVSGTRTAGNVNPIRTRYGAIRQIAWWDTTLSDRSGSLLGVLAIGHDITELLVSQERALRDERLAAIGETMEIIVHESRNGLDAIGLHVRLLEDEVRESGQAVQRHTDAIKDAHFLIRHLFDDLRDFAAPFQIDRASATVNDLWRRAWETLGADARGARLIERVGDTKLVLPVDAMYIEQVFRNLFENSLAACPGPVDVVIHAEELELDGARFVRLSIRDDGPGIPGQEAAKVFDPFYTTKSRGTGLGLAVVRRIVEAHGGTVALVEDDRPGAEFAITLPAGP